MTTRNGDANCFTIVVGRKASATGRVLLGHNEDDGGRLAVRHGYVPARAHGAGECLPCEPGRARIPQVPHTFGFYWSEVRGARGGLSSSDLMINENGVCVVSNSACGSREDGDDAALLREGGIAYNLRRAVAERAKSARDGANIAQALVETWGYAPGGRLYIIADARDAFVLQLTRGKRWLCARVPEDAVAAIPNHYVVRSRRDAEEVSYSPDLVSYALSRGWTASEEEFDFYEAYQNRAYYLDPLNTLRQDHILRRLTGRVFDRTRLPFAAPPAHPCTPKDLMDALACHYEGMPEDVRSGPGRSPHFTDVSRVCRDGTIESTVVDFAETPQNLTAWVAFGRPCQQPHLPLHPLCGGADAVDTMDDPAAALEAHLLPGETGVSWRRDAWQALRDFGNLAEFFHAECEDALRAFRDEWYETRARANRERTESAPRFDARQAADAVKATERFAAERFRRAAVSVDTAEDGRCLVSFDCAEPPREEALLFAPGGANLLAPEIRALPGSLVQTGAGRWRAAFSPQALAGLGKGVFECFLAGVTEGGRSFAGMVLVEREDHRPD